MEINEPKIASDYQDREVQAALSVLIELGQILGAYNDSYVIIGGTVPWLLLGDSSPPHLGTLDVDLALSPEKLADGEYAQFVETLENAGYIRGLDGLKPFQLLRQVKVDEGDEIPVIVDLLAPRQANIKGARPQLVPGLRVQQADGCEVALENTVSKEVRGKMPDGRNNTVELPVASISALLVMKGYAISNRNKMKDAYDVYYSIRNYPTGANGLGEECRNLLSQPIAKEGFRLLALKFKNRDDFGPQTVRIFLEDASDEFNDLEPEQVQTDAFEQVNAFLQALDL